MFSIFEGQFAIFDMMETCLCLSLLSDNCSFRPDPNTYVLHHQPDYPEIGVCESILQYDEIVYPFAKLINQKSANWQQHIFSTICMGSTKKSYFINYYC
jgi:hypothetical protein